MESLRDNLVNKIGEENLRKIENVRVGVAGAGGLGSNCALSLVRSGFKKFVIADFDRVELANLDRQFYFFEQVGLRKVEALRANLLKVNPYLELDTVDKRIERENIKELFHDCDIIVEGFDRPDYKSMLISELSPLGKFIVSASGLGGVGSSDEIKVHRINNNLAVIGDLVSDIERFPALSPRVSLAAAKQADVVLDYVISKKV